MMTDIAARGADARPASAGAKTAVRTSGKAVAAKPLQPATPVVPAPAAPVAAIDPTVAPTAASAAKDRTMTDTMQTTETLTAKAETMFAAANDRAKGAMQKGQQLVGEMNDFNKGNIEAIVESSKIVVRGLETVGQDAAAFAKQSFEHASTTIKSMAAVKSPTELMKLQSDFMRSSFDAMVAHGSRSTETMLKLAGEVAQPISTRFALAAEKVKAAA